jgi:hypothetical protein
MAAWPVSARVGNVRNNDPSLIEPIELTAAQIDDIGAHLVVVEGEVPERVRISNKAAFVPYQWRPSRQAGRSKPRAEIDPGRSVSRDASRTRAC